MASLTRRDEPKRKSRNNREVYRSNRWHKYSLAYRKANPLCVVCLAEGKTHKAEVVDHIVPMSQGGSVWDKDNHQSLCIHHHNQKTYNEQRTHKEDE